MQIQPTEHRVMFVCARPPQRSEQLKPQEGMFVLFLDFLNTCPQGSLCSFHLQISELMRPIVKQPWRQFWHRRRMYQGWGVRENAYKVLIVWHLLYIKTKEISIFYS